MKPIWPMCKIASATSPPRQQGEALGSPPRQQGEALGSPPRQQGEALGSPPRKQGEALSLACAAGSERKRRAQFNSRRAKTKFGPRYSHANSGQSPTKISQVILVNSATPNSKPANQA